MRKESIDAAEYKRRIRRVDRRRISKRQTLEAEIKELEASGDTLLEEQLKLEAELKDIRKNQWSEKKKRLLISLNCQMIGKIKQQIH